MEKEKLSPADFSKLVVVALSEDRANQDITCKSLFNSSQRVTAQIIAQREGILCGIDAVSLAFQKMDSQCIIQKYARDGERIKPAQKILTVKGRANRILAAERTALNFLQHLSGVATMTKKFVSAVKGTEAKIYDTRKTIPGLRALQKYAVRCGGGENHRMNLSEMAMVKDNHLKIVGSSELGVRSLKSKLPKGVQLEIEAKNLKEVELALNSKADIIMLDNMTIPQLKKAVHFIRSYRPPHLNPLPRGERAGVRVLIEVSGGVNLRNVRQIARLGVDRISVGMITHSAPALDLSLEVVKTYYEE